MREYRLLIGLAYERFSQLAKPIGGQESPVTLSGLSTREWMRLAGITSKNSGLNTEMASVVRMLYPADMDTGIQPPQMVAHDALRRLNRECRIERIGEKWRPVING